MATDKTVTIHGDAAAEHQMVLAFLIEAAKVTLTPIQQEAALVVIASLPTSVTLVGFLDAVKADVARRDVLAPLVAALDPINKPGRHGRLFDATDLENYQTLMRIGRKRNDGVVVQPKPEPYYRKFDSRKF